jgi:hypothetical protein
VKDRPGVQAEVGLDEHGQGETEEHEARQQAGRALPRPVERASQE